MQTFKSQSDVKPPEWDLTSSPTTVYHNYDVETKTDENGTHFEYMVDKMDFQECGIILLGQIAKLSEENKLQNKAIIAIMDKEVSNNV